MLDQAWTATDEITFVRGSATETGLGVGTSDLVTSGQAFHWFEPGATLGEIRRILSPLGWAAAFWNISAGSPLTTELEELPDRLAANYTPLSERVEACLRSIGAGTRTRLFQRVKVPNQQTLGKEELLLRLHSSISLPRSTASEELRREVFAMFDRHSFGEQCALKYKTVAAIWQVDVSE